MTRTDLLAACAGGMAFTADMAQAVAEGRKTRTVWAMKPQPVDYRDLDDCLHGCPEAKFRPGDIVFVKEPWFYYNSGDLRGYSHQATDGKIGACWWGYGPAKTMPQEAARAFLRITGVKEQRPLDLHMNEMQAEGCIPDGVKGGQWQHWQQDYWLPLFYSIYPPETWGYNPWCWVYEFERVEVEVE